MNSIAPPPTAMSRVGRPEPAARVMSLRVVPLSENLSAAFFDAPEDLEIHGADLVGTTGGQALDRPLIMSQLSRNEGGIRILFLLSRSARALCRDGLDICRRGRPVASFDPLALQSPLVDPLALLSGLSPEGGRRLLKLLLTTGLSLFGPKAFDGFRDLVTHLLASLTPPTVRLQAWCPIGKQACIASYILPKGTGFGSFRELVLLDSGHVQRIAEFSINLEPAEDGAQLMHLTLPVALRSEATLVALSETPVRLSGPQTPQSARPLGPWLEKRSGLVRCHVRSTLRTLAPTDTIAAALLDEVECPRADQPRAQAHLLAGSARGLLYAISVRDPRNLLQRIVLGTSDVSHGIGLHRAVHHPAHGPMQVGYLRCDALALADGGAALSLQYRTGRVSHQDPVKIASLCHGIPDRMLDILDPLPEDAVYRALAQTYDDALPARKPLHAERIVVGTGPQPVSCCLVVEIGQSLDYPHALMSALRGRRDVSILLHHADPMATPLLLRLVRELQAIYGLETAVAVLPQTDSLPAERLRAVLRCVTAPVSILIADDALPRGHDWVARWAEWLAHPGPPRMAGGVLVNHDGTIRDAGARIAPDATSTRVHCDLLYTDLLARGAGPMAADLFNVGLIGMNAAARARLARLPLRAPGANADMSRLAKVIIAEGGSAAIHPELAAVAHNAPKPVHRVVARAENSLVLRSA